MIFLQKCKQTLHDFATGLPGCSVDMYVFRGISKLRYTYWLSTSLDASVAQRFALGGGGFGSLEDSSSSPQIMRIKIPAGAQCIPFFKSNVMRPSEFEILILGTFGKLSNAVTHAPLLEYSAYGFNAYDASGIKTTTTYIKEMSVPCNDYEWQPEPAPAVGGNALKLQKKRAARR